MQGQRTKRFQRDVPSPRTHGPLCDAPCIADPRFGPSRKCPPQLGKLLPGATFQKEWAAQCVAGRVSAAQRISSAAQTRNALVGRDGCCYRLKNSHTSVSWSSNILCATVCCSCCSNSCARAPMLRTHASVRPSIDCQAKRTQPAAQRGGGRGWDFRVPGARLAPRASSSLARFPDILPGDTGASLRAGAAPDQRALGGRWMAAAAAPCRASPSRTARRRRGLRGPGASPGNHSPAPSRTADP